MDWNDLVRRMTEAETEGHGTTHPRAELEELYGRVWDQAELERDFEVRAYNAGRIVVRRRHDGAMGVMSYQNSPRFFWSFTGP